MPHVKRDDLIYLLQAFNRAGRGFTMSLSNWQWSTGFGAFAAFVSCACSGLAELPGEQAAAKREAVWGTVPQKIAADSYDRAFDSTPDVNYGAYVTECDRRHDGVDIDRNDYPDPAAPCSIGWTTSGEWLEYDVHASYTQTVDIKVRVASDLADRHFQISIDGLSLGDRVLERTGNWGYQYISYPAVALSAGQHTLRFTFDSDSIDLNYLELTPAVSTALPVESLLPPIDAVASSLEYPVLSAALAIDADPSTRWSSQFSDPQWIYVDLGAPRLVSRVLLSWETAASQSYEIGVSDSSEGPWTGTSSASHQSRGATCACIPVHAPQSGAIRCTISASSARPLSRAAARMASLRFSPRRH